MAKMSRRQLRQMILEQAAGAGDATNGSSHSKHPLLEKGPRGGGSSSQKGPRGSRAIDTDMYMRLQSASDPMIKLVGVLMEELYHGNASRSPDRVRKVLSQIEDML